MSHRYAPGLTEGDYTTDFLANPRPNSLRARFETAEPSNATTALAVLSADSDLAFLLDNYRGDFDNSGTLSVGGDLANSYGDDFDNSGTLSVGGDLGNQKGMTFSLVHAFYDWLSIPQ